MFNILHLRQCGNHDRNFTPQLASSNRPLFTDHPCLTDIKAVRDYRPPITDLLPLLLPKEYLHWYSRKVVSLPDLILDVTLVWLLNVLR